MVKYVVMYKTDLGHEYYRGAPNEVGGERCWTSELTEAKKFDESSNLLTAFSCDKSNRANYIMDPTNFFFVPVP